MKSINLILYTPSSPTSLQPKTHRPPPSPLTPLPHLTALSPLPLPPLLLPPPTLPLKPPRHPLKLSLPSLSIPRNLQNIPRRHIINLPPLHPLMRQRPRRHRKAHIARAIDELEDGRRRLILLQRLDAQHAGVAAGPCQVALADRAEEFRDECDGVLSPDDGEVLVAGVDGANEAVGGGERGEGGGETNVEDLSCAATAGFGVLLAHGDEFLGEALGFFGFGPGGGDGFVLEEGSDEIPEEGLAVRGGAA